MWIPYPTNLVLCLILGVLLKNSFKLYCPENLAGRLREFQIWDGVVKTHFWVGAIWMYYCV